MRQKKLKNLSAANIKLRIKFTVEYEVLEKMDVENINKDDLGDFSYLVSVEKNEKIFAVPVGYFDEFPALLLLQLRLKELKHGNNIYSVTENYFSVLPNKILQKIKQELNDNEIETPLLSSITKLNVYTVPENYFEKLNKQISSVVNEEKKEIKIIPINTKRKTWRMTVAAAVVSVVVLSAGLFWENKNENDTKQRIPLAGVISHSGDIQENLSDLSNEEIADYLNLPDGSEEDLMPQNSIEQTNTQLNTLSVQDVENYLEKTPTQY